MVTPTSDRSFWDALSTQDLGRPTGATTQVQPNVYKRTFTKGTVYLNASNQTVTVDGLTLARDTGLLT